MKIEIEMTDEEIEKLEAHLEVRGMLIQMRFDCVTFQDVILLRVLEATKDET